MKIVQNQKNYFTNVWSLNFAGRLRLNSLNTLKSGRRNRIVSKDNHRLRGSAALL